MEQPPRGLNGCEESERSREAEKSLGFKKHGIGRRFKFINYIKNGFCYEVIIHAVKMYLDIHTLNEPISNVTQYQCLEKFKI